MLAFSAAMRRLPGHSTVRSGPLKATAHTIPSRLTIAAHSWFPIPVFADLPSLTTACTADLSLSWSGNEPHPGLGGCCAANPLIVKPAITAILISDRQIRLIIEFVPPSSAGVNTGSGAWLPKARLQLTIQHHIPKRTHRQPSLQRSRK